MLDQDLLPAELLLVDAGEVELSHGEPPAGGASWSPERTIRAPILRDALHAGPASKLRIVGARITGTLDIEGMTISRSVVFERCYFDERLCLPDAELVSLRMPGCHLAGGLDARGCRLRGDLVLDSGFEAHDEVSLVGAVLGGAVFASEGRFINPGGCAINADRVTTGGTVFLSDGFEAIGEIRLMSASISGALDCTRGRFVNPGGIALACDRLTVDGSMFCRRGFSAEGAVRLINARVRGELSCSGGRFCNRSGDAIRADGLRVDSSLLCTDGFHAEGQVRLLAAQIGAQLAFIDCVVTRPGRLALDLEAVRVGGELFLRPRKAFDGLVDLTNADVGALLDSADAWAGGYQLRGCRYGRLRSSRQYEHHRRSLRADPAVRHRLGWLRGNSGGYLPQLYDQLSAVYGAAGEEAHQRDVLIAKQRQRRRHLPWYSAVWNLVQDLLIGFGYRTGRALVPFVLALAFGTWFFAGAYEDGKIVPRTTAENAYVPPFKPFVYSLDQLVPVVNFTQRENWIATGGAQSVATVMIIVGWILTTAIVAALTGLVRRNQ